MTQSVNQTSNALRMAYRISFQDYADKLNTLQRLIDGGGTAGDREVHGAIQAVEDARTAHSSARDRLAKELLCRAASSSGDEQQIRRTARLIWEFAGRPEGTAECDWYRAEKLVHAAAC